MKRSVLKAQALFYQLHFLFTYVEVPGSLLETNIFKKSFFSVIVHEGRFGKPAMFRIWDPLMLEQPSLDKLIEAPNENLRTLKFAGRIKVDIVIQCNHQGGHFSENPGSQGKIMEFCEIWKSPGMLEKKKSKKTGNFEENVMM